MLSYQGSNAAAMVGRPFDILALTKHLIRAFALSSCPVASERHGVVFFPRVEPHGTEIDQTKNVGKIAKIAI